MPVSPLVMITHPAEQVAHQVSASLAGTSKTQRILSAAAVVFAGCVIVKRMMK